MKKLYVFMVLSLYLFSCSESNKSEPRNLNNEIIPLSVGNYWEYRYWDGNPELWDVEKINILYQDKITKEVYNPKTKNTETKTYDIFIDWIDDTEIEELHVGYIILENEIEKVSCKKINGKLFYNLHYISIPRSPSIGWYDKDCKWYFTWKGMATVKVNAGIFNCWYCERIEGNLISREYYTKKVGCVLSYSINNYGDTTSKYELYDYKIKSN